MQSRCQFAPTVVIVYTRFLARQRLEKLFLFFFLFLRRCGNAIAMPDYEC